ncbi:MAG: hypothetical protein ACI38Q_03245 [Candidatus Bruticola sp.]
MKCKFSTFILIALLGAAALFTPACSKNSATKPAPTVIKNSSFKMSSPAADRYESIEGTALYSSAPDIKEHLAALGGQAPNNIKAFFILLNSKAPSEAILVQAPSDVPEEAYKSPNSSIVVVTGNVKSVNCPPLAAYLKEALGVNLALTSSGELAYIEAETPINFNLPGASQKAPTSKVISLPLEGTPLSKPKDEPVETNIVSEDEPSPSTDYVPKEADSISDAASNAQSVSESSEAIQDNSISADSSGVPEAVPTPHYHETMPEDGSVQPTPAI